jgi:hypothetical protein
MNGKKHFASHMPTECHNNDGEREIKSYQTASKEVSATFQSY